MDARNSASLFTQITISVLHFPAIEPASRVACCASVFPATSEKRRGLDERRNTDESPYAYSPGRGRARGRRARLYVARAGVEAGQARLARDLREQRRCGQRDQSVADAEAEPA